MDVKVAAASLLPKILQSASLPEQDCECGKDHLAEMVNKISTNVVTEEKAHRWLGYIQGVLVCSGTCNLHEMKLNNKEA